MTTYRCLLKLAVVAVASIACTHTSGAPPAPYPAPGRKARPAEPLTVQSAKELMDASGKRLDDALSKIRDIQFRDQLDRIDGVPPAKAIELYQTVVIPELRKTSGLLIDNHRSFENALSAYRSAIKKAIPAYGKEAERLEQAASGFQDPDLIEMYAKLGADVRKWRRGFEQKLDEYESLEDGVRDELKFVEASRRFLDDFESTLALLPKDDSSLEQIEGYLEQLARFRHRMKEMIRLLGDQNAKSPAERDLANSQRSGRDARSRSDQSNTSRAGHHSPLLVSIELPSPEKPQVSSPTVESTSPHSRPLTAYEQAEHAYEAGRRERMRRLSRERTERSRLSLMEQARIAYHQERLRLR